MILVKLNLYRDLCNSWIKKLEKVSKTIVVSSFQIDFHVLMKMQSENGKQLNLKFQLFIWKIQVGDNMPHWEKKHIV